MMLDHVTSNSLSTPAQRAPASSDYTDWRVRLSSWWEESLYSAPSYFQLPQHPEHQLAQSEADHLAQRMETSWPSKARWRTYWFALVLCCGGALFGYDSGVIGMPTSLSIESRVSFLTHLQAEFSHLSRSRHLLVLPPSKRPTSAPSPSAYNRPVPSRDAF